MEAAGKRRKYNVSGDYFEVDAIETTNENRE
jgi:hypothetical protein